MKYIFIFLTLIILSSFAVSAHDGHFVEIDGVRYELGSNHKFAIIYQHPNHKFVAQAYPVLNYADIRVHPSSSQSVELYTDSGEVGYLGKINWTSDVKIVSPHLENTYLKSLSDFSVGFLLDNNQNLYINTGLQAKDTSFAESKLGEQLIESNVQDIQTDDSGNVLIITSSKTTVIDQNKNAELTDVIYQTDAPIKEKTEKIKQILALHSVENVEIAITETPVTSITPEETTIIDQAEEINKLKEDYNKLQLKAEEQDKRLTTFESMLKNITDFLSNIFKFKTS